MLRALVVVLVLGIGAMPVLAAEKEAVDFVAARPNDIQFQVPMKLAPPVTRRPAVLPALYAGFVALQVLDARTTAGAIGRGAAEVNPLLRQGNTGAVWAVKAATTASTVYFVERLWKKDRIAAVLVMAGINGGYAAIAAHNARQGR